MSIRLLCERISPFRCLHSSTGILDRISAVFNIPASSLTCQQPPLMAMQAEPYDNQWIEQWKDGVNPGTKWDAGKISPTLDNLLRTDLDIQGRRVLVPGCGRGYDVFAFAEAGAALAVGLDLSEHAISAAEEQRSTQLSRSPAAYSASELTAADFFSYTHSSGLPFDVGYDYTFLCALHPDMRADWAASWARLLNPGGELVTMIFPVGGNPPGAPQNPPWPVTPELYQELLLPAGFEQVYLEAIPADLSHRGRAGREWLGRWRRSTGNGSSAAGNGSSLAANGSANEDDSIHSSATAARL